MRGIFKYIRTFPLLALLSVLCACGGHAHGPEHSASADSVYSAISSLRYSDTMLLDSLGNVLLRVTPGDNEAQAVATNAKAYSSLMNMDYAKADSMYAHVLENSACEIERLVAAVGMMTIDYRVSANRRFFDDRLKALELIKRINEDYAYLSKNDKERFERAKIEFGIVSVCYFANLGMQEEKMKSMF